MSRRFNNITLCLAYIWFEHLAAFEDRGLTPLAYDGVEKKFEDGVVLRSSATCFLVLVDESKAKRTIGWSGRMRVDFSTENGLSEILGTHLASSHITFSASVHFVFLFLSHFLFVLRPHDSGTRAIFTCL